MLQTAAFTNELKADFAFAIVVSVIFSIIAQLNVWTIIGISQMRGQDIANKGITRPWVYSGIFNFPWWIGL